MAHYETNPISIIINGVKQAFSKSQQLAIMLIVLPLIVGVISFVGQIFGEVFGAVFSSTNNRSTGVVAVGVVLFVLAILLQIFIQVLFIGFQAFALTKIAKGEDATFGQALEHAFSKFWKVILVQLMLFIYVLPFSVGLTALIVMAISVGSISSAALAISLPVTIIFATFLIVQIIRTCLKFTFAVNYLFEGARSVGEAFEKSKQLTKGRLSEVFGVLTIGGLVPLITSLATTSGMSMLFMQLTEARRTKAVLPKPHILNYLAPAIGLLFIGFVALILLAVYLSTNAG